VYLHRDALILSQLVSLGVPLHPLPLWHPLWKLQVPSLSKLHDSAKPLHACAIESQ
jgi:hypothetical protein